MQTRFQLARVPHGGGSCRRRTGHPFAVSGRSRPSQMIEFVFAASPETIRREPQEIALRRSVGHRTTWQPARCVICSSRSGRLRHRCAEIV